jgi:CRP-like cAMP-binding protein
VTTLEELRRVPLLKGLTDEQLREVLEEGSEEFVPAGEVGGREGEPVEHLYVILEGEFRWSKRVDGGEVVMNTYGSGEFFAEVPLLLGKPFLATWRALANSRVFALPNETFRRMLATDPSFSNAILEMLAQRIQVLYSVAQQRERLSSLGTMAAGLAHELNNPAAASRRAAGRLREGSENLRCVGMRLARAAARRKIGPAQLDALERIVREALGRDKAPALDTLKRSEREDEVGLWLEDHGVEDAWDLAPILAAAGLDTQRLDELAGELEDDRALALPGGDTRGGRARRRGRGEFNAHLEAGRHHGGLLLHGPSTDTGGGYKRRSRQHPCDP